MIKRFDFGEIHLETQSDPSTGTLEPETPFRIALLGDFTGRANRGLHEPSPRLAARRAIAVDRDNFDEVLGKMAPGLRLPIGRDGSTETLTFSELDDFLPDRLYEQVGMFARLRELRLRLADPSTFASAAGELGLGDSSPRAEKTVSAKPSKAERPDPESLAGGSLLDRMIEQSETRSPESRPSRAPDELQEFVRRVTEPHLVAAPDARQPEALAAVDRAVSAQMRALLHVPDFQALEAAWRAVFFLVRRIETSPQLKIFLIDVSKQEMAADVGASPDLRDSGLYRLLVEKTVGTPGAEPWALLVGNYTFGPGREDAELLGKLAKIASAAGAPFLAAADSKLVGCPSFGKGSGASPSPRDWRIEAPAQDTEAWAALRGLPQASHVGLLLPRLLMRLPYGRDTREAESFAFEEMSAGREHEDYLWGNPAFAAALLLAQAFSEEGWDMQPGAMNSIEGLPLHAYEQDGEQGLQPCAEALLTEDAAERILESGVMPLVSIKGQDVARLVRFQSIAHPLTTLMGRWSGL